MEEVMIRDVEKKVDNVSTYTIGIESSKHHHQTTGEGSEPSHDHLEDSLISSIQSFINKLNSNDEGFRGINSDSIIKNIREFLKEMYEKSESRFLKFFRVLVLHKPLQEVVDTFHSLLGFCLDTPPVHKIGPKGIESVIIDGTFKHLITRMVRMQKELRQHENLSLYSDLRQWINFIKEYHVTTFRLVALGALIDSAERLNLDESIKRKGGDILTSSGDRHGVFPFGEEGEKIFQNRKSFVGKKRSSAGIKAAPSNQSINEDYPEQWTLTAGAPIGLAISHVSSPSLLKVTRAASPRLSITDDEAIAIGKSSSQSKFNIKHWLKGDKNSNASKHGLPPDFLIPPSDNGYSSQPDTGSESQSRRSSVQGRRSHHQHRKHHGFMHGAYKRVEDQFSKFGFGRGKHKQGAFDESIELSRRNSYDFEHSSRMAGVLNMKEARLVSIPHVRSGMLRFSLLLEACNPGSLPDPSILAAMLDLRAPLVARAAFYLEVAHFVHSCNRGHWPPWMKLSLPIFRNSVPGKVVNARRGSSFNILHRAAGRMFYTWAEAIGARLEDMQIKEAKAISSNLDDVRKRQLRICDEDEDFLNESIVNPNGTDCPFALKVAACQVLHEITVFLRETHQYVPSRGASGRPSFSKQGDSLGPPKPSHEPRTITANRRWSMALSSLGFSQQSAHSLASLADQHQQIPPAPGERRISFVLHEADGEVNSIHSSNASTNQGESSDMAKRMSTSGPSGNTRSNLLRRGTGSGAGLTGSFKRRSLKLKKGDRKTRHRSSTIDDGAEDNSTLGPSSLLRRDSIRSKGRRASAFSERSDLSGVSGDESPGVLSDDGQPPDLISDTLEAEDSDIVRHMPWIKVVVDMVNTLDFECQHQHYCQDNCYRRQIRACSRMMRAVKKVYTYEEPREPEPIHGTEKRHRKKHKKDKKSISGTGNNSPIPRNPSCGHNMDKIIDRDTMAQSQFSSGTFINQVDIEAGTKSPNGHHDDKKVPEPWAKKVVVKEDVSALRYLKNHVKGLFQCPLSLLIKSTLILPQHLFIEQLVLSWEMILEDQQDLAATAAVGFIIASIKCPDLAKELVNKELQHEDPVMRITAIIKFYSVWKARYQCWPRMEEGAHLSFKVPPPMIEFTLPSPKIALDTMPVPDPPWMPTIQSKVEEVTISQEQSVQKSFVTATKTRRKQQIEIVQRAIEEEQQKMREERETFRISAVPVTLQAAYEPALFHTIDEHEEGTDEDGIPSERPSVPHVQVAQAMFPSCLCTASITIINLLDDPQVSATGSAVYEVAYKVIWHCLVEDTTLFLRHFFEKLTRDNPKDVFKILRRLIRFMPRLPAQTAYTLYNYLIGFVMYNVRVPSENSQQLIGDTLSVLWLVVPSVHGLFLKDLKQILRKEQCDANLLITANVPSAKRIIVHGPEGEDMGGIPSQFPIQEDTQFFQILVDSLDFFGIDEKMLNQYYLVDNKTNQIHNLNAFVRDFYFFKRSTTPQLSLVRMNPSEALEKLHQQAFSLQFLEHGKALMSLSIVKSNYLAIKRVLFLHEELMKLPSFPRKALEANFSLYRGKMGKEMLGMDTLHKIVWVRLVARMFEITSSFFAQSTDIHLFINVVNGALILHCEDAAVLRLCMATYINVAHQFKSIFSINGYLLIIPTILRIYSNHQTNRLLCRTIEFVCKQFYIMHRKPFLLQMFGSAAPLLDTDNYSAVGDATKIQPIAFFKLLQSLGHYIVDPLDILELVDVEKPLKALDVCYQMDPETVTILDTISLCVTVVSYSADSMRSHQMLTILEAILPLYMRHIQGITIRKETPGGPRTELSNIHNISVCIRTLISNCEALTRNFTGPQRTIDLRGSSMKTVTKQGINSPPIEIDDDSHSKYIGDSTYGRSKQYTGDEDSEDIRHEFRRPRDTLLNLVAEFLTRSTARLADLSKKVPDLHQKGSSHELLDVKCHLRLAEVAHSLLKVAPYDPQTMGCRGLVRYMTEVLPTSEWRQETMRPALTMILRRLDKMFTKIAKKTAIKRLTDWDAAKRLLKGVYMTFVRHPYIVHLPHLKSLISVCQLIILGDPKVPVISDISSAFPTWAATLAQSPPAGFTSVAVRLIAMQMIQMGEVQTLETICGTNLSPEKTGVYLMNMIYPMAIRISGGLKDVPKLRSCDVIFTLNVILNSLTPSVSKSTSTKGSDSQVMQSNTVIQNCLHQIGFLGLKIVMICFDRLLSGEYHRIARCIRELVNRNAGGVTLWNFMDYVVTHRSPLFLLLMPMIRFKLLNRNCTSEQEYYYQQQIRQKLSGRRMPSCRSKGQLLVSLITDLKNLKDDLVNRKPGQDEKKTDPSFGHRLSFAISSAFQSSTKNVAIASPPVSGTPTDPSSPIEKTSTAGGAPSSSLSRVFSFRDKKGFSRGLSVKLPSKSSESGRQSVPRFSRRGSCPTDDPLQLTGPSKSFSPVSSSTRSSLRTRAKKVEEETIADIASPTKDSLKSPEESITSDTYEEDSSLTGVSGADNGSGEDSEARKMYRLQRQKGKSRKTFRFRKGSKKGNRNTEESDNTNKTDPDTFVEEDPNMISIDGRDSAQGDHQPLATTASQQQNVTTDQTEIESKNSSTKDQQQNDDHDDEQKEGQK